MPSWSWRQAVADFVLRLVNVNQRTTFQLEELYAAEQEFKRLFPNNQHIQQIIRKTLQQLRDDGLLTFADGKGEYRLNWNNSELAYDETTSTDAGIDVVEIRRFVRNVRLRNTLLAADIKRRYENVCQVCRDRIQLTSSTYSEAHHLKPLGGPHFGPDVERNIIVLCPNHHVMFDRAALYIDPGSMRVVHRQDRVGPYDLHLLDWHQLDPDLVAYAASLTPAC